MNSTTITVKAMLQADGVTLYLNEKLSLPPGGVTVTVQQNDTRSGPTMLEVLDRFRLENQQSGRKPMTEEEIAAEIAEMRGDDKKYEERWREIWSQTETAADGTPPLG